MASLQHGNVKFTVVLPNYYPNLALSEYVNSKTSITFLMISCFMVVLVFPGCACNLEDAFPTMTNYWT